MTDWLAVVDALSLEAGQVMEVTCRDEDLLLYRTQDGEVHALSAYCPHLNNYMPNGLPPGWGLEELLYQGELQCPYHGWRFNTEGQCVYLPQGQRVPPAVSAGASVLRRWAVREVEGRLEIGQLLP